MAQLDKTFPTLDCSICILAPKMVSVYRHPNIDLYTYSEVVNARKSVDGSCYRLKILKKARYVDTEKCTGCGICSTKCASRKNLSEFEDGLGTRSAIYIPFPQAVPRKATIDAENCLYLSNKEKGLCKVCERICPAEAIDYEMQDETIEIDAASIIVATGFDIIDLESKPALQRYNFDRFKNVITAMQFERMLSASGPTEGHVVKLSDHKEPKNIGFILCVGSRNLDACKYCSKFCCMYSTKEAVVTKEHAPNIDITIFYNDLRVIGKNQEEFVVRAEHEYGINFIRGIPAELKEDPQTKEIVVRHADLISGNVLTKKFDLVVLASAVVPSAGTDKLASILNIDLSKVGFYSTKNTLSQVESSSPGVFLAGCCQGPDDIQTCVTKASAAAAEASKRAIPLSPAAQLERKPQYEERYIPKAETPHVGVFICECGSNIGGFVDVPGIVEILKTDPSVDFVMHNMYTCSQDSQEIIKSKIHEHNLNRVIVAACTPRTHESLFQETLREAGLNPYLFSFVSIRELVSWVHMKEPEEAKEKALDLIKMGIERVKRQEPLYSIRKEANREALIIGGGIAGINAALEISSHGFKSHLIEQKSMIGGQLNQVGKFNFNYLDGLKLLADYQSRIKKDKNIRVYTDTEVVDVSGSIGNFLVSLKSNPKSFELNPGVIIVATGADEFKPDNLFHYGEDGRIQTQLEYSVALEQDNVQDGETIVFVQCVGSRGHGDRSYCSLICCSETLRHVMFTKERYPNTNIFVLYRDIRVSFEDEISYWKAREFVNYIRFKDYPSVEPEADKIKVCVKDMLTQANLELTADRVVLATPLIPSKQSKALSEKLKVPLGSNGFFLEAHPKLRPVDFATDGIFVCGTAQGPKGFSESISQARAAAGRALKTLTNGYVESEPIIAEVDSDLCIGCQICNEVCAFDAIGVDLSSGKIVSEVNPLLCKGCGTCAAVCPAEAITLHHFTTEQIDVMIDESLKTKNSEPKIVAFLCNWCSYAGADTAGVSRFQYPPNIRPIRVMCSGRIDPNFIIDAFLKGADGVLVGGCHIGDCHYLKGNYHARERFYNLLGKLKDAGIDPHRIRLEWISASEGKKFAKVISEFTEEIRDLGSTKVSHKVSQRMEEIK